MSRTTRKRAESFYQYYKYWFDNKLWDDEKEIIQRKVRYHTSSDKWISHCLPKGFRKTVNRSRRNKDKREIYKAINFDGYEEQCSKWNCKDNNSWGYW